MGEVGDEILVRVEHLRADRYAQLDVLPVRAVLAGTAPSSAAPGCVPALRAKRGKVTEVGIGDEPDVAACAAVAAIWPPFGNVLLAPEAERAVSPTPGDRVEASAIVEHVKAFSR
jgi:hypothetical protein